MGVLVSPNGAAYGVTVLSGDDGAMVTVEIRDGDGVLIASADSVSAIVEIMDPLA